MNGLSTRLFFTGAVGVPEAFRVRRALARTYRYFEPTPPLDPDRWERAARLFQGRIDVRSLGRAMPTPRPQWRPIDSVETSWTAEGALVEVRAPSFVWGMVRKIVGALREVDRERLSVARLTAALAGHERLTLPMAEPEPLVLWAVDLPVRWQYRWEGPNRHQQRYWATARAEARARQRVLGALDAGLSAEGSLS
jgi:tRNA pseudouridine(38-40) synthase